MASKLTPEQKKEYEEAFCYFDRDHDGAIATTELGQIMKCLGQNPTPAELEAMIKEADKGGKGKIRLADFLNLMGKMNRATVSADELVKSFKFFDPKETGFIPAKEMKHVMKSIGEKLSEQEVEEMLKGCDIDGKGNLNYKSFIKSMLA